MKTNMMSTGAIRLPRSTDIPPTQFRSFSRLFYSICASAAVAGLFGCGGTPATVSTQAFKVNYVLAPVEGGTCSAVNSLGTQFKGTTVAGVASFEGNICTSSTGLVKVSCSGGTYKDEATGTTKTAVPLNTFISCSSTSRTVSATPLTELAVRAAGARPTEATFATSAAKTAAHFGLKGVDINAITPVISTSAKLPDSTAGKYGAVLTVFSQMEKDGKLGSSASAVMDALAGAVDAKGDIKKGSIATQNAFKSSLQTALANPLLKDSVPADMVKEVFDEASDEDDPLASIDYVNTDFSLDRDEVSQTIRPNTASIINLVGENLHLKLKVTLGGKACLLRDLAPLDGGESAEQDNDQEEIFADCPAVVAGVAKLVIKDGEEIVGEFDMLAQIPVAKRAVMPRLLAAVTGAGAGGETVSGSVTALAPKVDSTTGGHSYATADLRTFFVKGVVVELLDANAGNAVLAEDLTDQNGSYSFTNVLAGSRVIVRVKAHLKSPAGAAYSWDIPVRDNTSASSPKAIYTLDSTTTLVAGGQNTVNLVAGIGFNPDGSVDTSKTRQSGPFSILELIYIAADNLRIADGTVKMPSVNVYWSVDNVGTSGDKAKGQIGTSHFSDSGALPGVFILGKADVDTDEFDQGVIGHELGHYLQSVLSYSDNPGGSHSTKEFKDASLAYGEGYGTAIGGMLSPLCGAVGSSGALGASGCRYYIDTAGVKQGAGGVTDLDQYTRDGVRKGFYSEESVGIVMYQMGKRHGFTPLWKAIVAMRSSHESATIFSFLAQYVKANPNLDIQSILDAENIKTKHALGVSTAIADSAISSVASKGAATTGADDLEVLYINLTMTTPTYADAAVVASADSSPFCFNRNLNGASNSNGLGMRKRFTFTATFTGNLGLKFVNDLDKLMSSNDYALEGRDSLGNKVSFYMDDAFTNFISVTQGRSYTVSIGAPKPEDIFNGSRCGHKLALWRLS